MFENIRSPVLRVNPRGKIPQGSILLGKFWVQPEERRLPTEFPEEAITCRFGSLAGHELCLYVSPGARITAQLLHGERVEGVIQGDLRRTFASELPKLLENHVQLRHTEAQLLREVAAPLVRDAAKDPATALEEGAAARIAEVHLLEGLQDRLGRIRPR